MMPKRERPLQAPHAEDAIVVVDGAAGAAPSLDGAAAPAPAPAVPASTAAIASPGTEARRVQRLAEGVRQLRIGGGSLKFNERALLIIGGILAPVGLLAILVGWAGASRTPNLFEQIPYAISGGLFGLGLVFLGSFMYFSHWITELVKEHRAQSAAVVEAITRLEDVLRTSAVPGGGGTAGVPAIIDTTADTASNGVVLVATEKGTMAHRPECVVVAGKVGLRPVSHGEALAPCKLCDPYAVGVN